MLIMKAQETKGWRLYLNSLPASIQRAPSSVGSGQRTEGPAGWAIWRFGAPQTSAVRGRMRRLRRLSSPTMSRIKRRGLNGAGDTLWLFCHRAEHERHLLRLAHGPESLLLPALV